jgi:beta-glucuronidase
MSLQVPVASFQREEAKARPRVDLGGLWQRYVNGKLFDAVQVPASLRPLGFYRLSRQFLLPELLSTQRAFVHFEAITYHGRASMNGAELGTMGPYVPYEFEFTKQAHAGENTIEVAVADLIPDPAGGGEDELALGVNPGWEAYGGIIRDVYVELRPSSFIASVRFGYQMNRGYARATCRARVFVSAVERTSGKLAVSLGQSRSDIVDAARQVELDRGSNEIEVAFDVPAPVLWCPEEPNLYVLDAKLETPHGEDHWSCATGLRDITIERNQFKLNDRALVLKGVCRHDMWKDQGFTLTPQQAEQDMRMIKALGCNFVRLVHYPHDRRVVELADQIGLLVSEEPGYWGMNFRTMPRSMIELGYEIMERTIRRDWNSPSVFAWLLGNECVLTVEYLREGKDRCRRLDPIARPVSFANSMNMKEAKPIFEQAGLDFFDDHPYVSDPDDYARVVDFYGESKPVTFTEWGWKDVGGGDIFPETQSDYLLDLVEAEKLAGHSFWSWQDIRQYSRIDWPTQNGVLLSGVVTEARSIRKDWYDELTGLFEGRRQEASAADVRPRVLPLRWQPGSPGAKFAPLDLQELVQSKDGQKSWSAFERAMAEYWPKTDMAQRQWQRTGSTFRLWQGSEVEIGGIPFRGALAQGYIRPIILTPDVPEFSVQVGRHCARLHILGQVTLPEGYPVSGGRGEVVANYEFVYSDGKSKVLPVRNGIETAQANLIDNATRINPVATAAQPALKFVKDVVREQYQVLLWSVPVEAGNLTRIVCRLNGRQPPLAIFAMTAETAD